MYPTGFILGINRRKLNPKKIDDIINKVPNLIKKENNFVKIKKDLERKANKFLKKIKSLI